MRFVARSNSIASPKVLLRNKILLPSCDQSARSPNQVTCVMCDGRWSAGFSPDFDSAARLLTATLALARAIAWNNCVFVVILAFSSGSPPFRYYWANGQGREGGNRRAADRAGIVSEARSQGGMAGGGTSRLTHRG